MVAAAAVTLALVAAAVGQLVDGVQLLDERVLFEIRARDVFTGDHPLLGLRSSASESGVQINHPGPLFFELLALPVRLLGGPVGVTVGLALLTIALVWILALAANALGGQITAVVMTAIAAALCWSMGSDLLLDAWTPNALVLPFFALLVTTAATAGGQWRWLPAVVALASLCAQSNLGYLLLGPAMVASAVGAIVGASRRTGRPVPWRLLGLSGALGLVLWLPPIVQQLFGPGPGNLAAVLAGSGDGAPRYGPSIALRLYSAVVAVPPAWLRPGYDRQPAEALTESRNGALVIDDSGLPSVVVALLIVLLVAALVVAALVSARRRRDVTMPPLVLVVATATGTALLTLALLPTDFFGIVAHKYRFLWPLAAFTTGALAAHVLHLAASAQSPALRRLAIVGPLAVAVMFAALTMPSRLQPAIDGTNRDVWPAVAELRMQLSDQPLAGPVVVETGGLQFPDVFTNAVLAELSRRAISFQVASDVQVRQLGEGRRVDGTGVTRLLVWVGSGATAPPGSRTVAFVDGGAPEHTATVYAEPLVPGG
ncbi:MAG: hypothetical protein ACR2HQ_11395 [Ilumatobacteraceae bacterium]